MSVKKDTILNFEKEVLRMGKRRKRKARQEREEKHFFITTCTSLSLLVLLTLATFIFSGCMAAIPLMMAAHAGLGALSVTKVVQMSTDGSVEMAIGENEVAEKNKLVLSEISKLAIWPDEGMVYVADELQKSKAFVLIATPSRTGKVIDQSEFDRRISNLTHTEKMLAFQTVCGKTGTEAIVVFENLGTSANMNMWSFSRASMDFKGKILIFELQTNQIIFSSITEMKMNLGGGTPNQREIMARAGKMLANRIIELKIGKQTATLPTKPEEKEEISD